MKGLTSLQHLCCFLPYSHPAAYWVSLQDGGLLMQRKVLHRSARTSSSHALASTSCSLSPFVAPFTSEAPLGYCVPRGGLKGLTWGRHLGDTPSAEWLWSPDSIRQFGGGERDWRFSSMVECSLALEHSRASVRPWNQCSAVGRGGVGGRQCAW